MKLWLLFVLPLALRAYTGSSPGTLTSDGTDTDVKAAIAAAAPGDIIIIPSGTYTWDEQVTIAEGITLRGAGAGGIVTRSTSSVTIGTGNKTFTVDSGLSDYLTVGRAVSAMALHNGEAFQMIGTVDSYSGTSLVINVASTVNTGPGGSTWSAWAIRLTADTTIVNNYTTGGEAAILMQVSSDSSSYNTVIDGIRFKWGTSTGVHMQISDGTKSTIIRNCEFSTYGMQRAITIRTNHGIIYKCSFDASLYSGDGSGNPATGNDDSALGFVAASLTDSWASVSTMGAADTTGLNNFYVEDCRFTGLYFQACDFEANARVVFRNNVMDNSATTSHGHDTSAHGLRHVEIYGNTFIRSSIGASGEYSYPLSYFVYLRGGTGVIYNNVFADIDSGWWGNKNEILLTTFNIRSTSGVVDCQTTYPASRQIGFGYVTGLGSYNTGPNSFVYKGDSEPLYIWGNSGDGNWTTPAIQSIEDTCGTNLNIADFIQLDRDYFVGTAKPGWSAYTYPHPLRGESSTPSFRPGKIRRLHR